MPTAFQEPDADSTVLERADETGRLCQLNLAFDIGPMFILATTSVKKMGSKTLSATKKGVVSISNNLLVLAQRVKELG